MMQNTIWQQFLMRLKLPELAGSLERRSADSIKIHLQ
jgi:hypothetical protein